MARYGFTVPVASGQMPSAQSNFSWVITGGSFPTAAIDGGATSILNGGGNLRCYTDSTKAVQLPVEVVSFVTGVTPSVIVWGLSPTLNVGGTVYIEADTVATSQPAVGAAFGRNAVWVDYKYVLHLNESPNATVDGYVNSTGLAGANGTALNTPQTSVVNTFGMNALSLDGTQNHIDFDNPIATGLANISTLISGWVNLNSLATDSRLMSMTGGESGSAIWMDSGGSGDGWAATSGTGGANAGENANNATTDWQYISLWNDGTAIQVYVDGSPTSSAISGTLDYALSRLVRLGRLWDIASYYSGAMSHVTITQIDKRDALLSTVNNQSSPTTFWGTPSAWEDQDGGGGVAGDVNFDVATVEFSVTGEASLPNPVGNANFDLLAVEFSGTGSATLPQPSGSVNFDVLAVEFSGTGSATAVFPVGNIAFDIGQIEFSGSGSATQPNPSGDISFDAAAVEFAGVGGASVPYPVGSAAFDIEEIEFSGAGSATFPQPSGNVNFTIGAIEFSGAGNATQPDPVGDISFDIEAIEFSASGSVTGIELPYGEIIKPKTESNVIILYTECN